jgi:ribosomal protein S18 acetylase RimI-like enzyme
VRRRLSGQRSLKKDTQKGQSLTPIGGKDCPDSEITRKLIVAPSYMEINYLEDELMDDQIADIDMNLFMMCKKLNKKASCDMPSSFHVRTCQKNELDIWKAMPFDEPELAQRYYDYMTKYFDSVYAKSEDLFFRKCLFVCNQDNEPIATCFAWKTYEKITTIHWFKVLKNYEGKGIGRALLSIVMNSLQEDEFPVFLHTQPGSFRAIKLYSDFGFYLLSDPIIGSRKNYLNECLPILKKNMPHQDYQNLRIIKSPKFFLDIVGSSKEDEF